MICPEKSREGCEAIIDDIIVYGKSAEKHDENLQNTFQVIKESGLKRNKEKCEIKGNKITYFGHVLSAEGVSPDPEKVKAITELQAPTNVPELRRLIGMINYLGRFIPNLATVMHPMTDLLKSDTAWTWGPPQQTVFTKVKEMISSTANTVLVFYDPKKPIVVCADASSYGIGGVLMQGPSDQLCPVGFCSRTLTETEVRYSQIEKECLAAVWTSERLSRYLVGLPSFQLLTDHKPLVPLINHRDLDKTPLRFQRLLMCLMQVNPRAEHVPGKDMVVTDTLSGGPCKLKQEPNIVENVQAFVHLVESTRPATGDQLKRIREGFPAPESDGVHIRRVPNTCGRSPLRIREFFDCRGHLSIGNGLLTYDDRIVIPADMREEILERIHTGHQGITKCRERANLSVWWPGISKEIKTKVESCQFCQENQPSQRKEPLMTTDLPDRPWQKVSTDLFELAGQKYLVVMDYYSRFIEILSLVETTSQVVIQKLKSVFARWGIPEELISDNGTQFKSLQFDEFKAKYGFKHTTSSPYHPQANGTAESGVRIAKRILKQEDPLLALMAYRATPIPATGKTPSELIMGRLIRTTLPTLTKVLEPKLPNHSAVKRADIKAKRLYKESFDKRND